MSPTTPSPSPAVIDLGRRPYPEVHRAMLDLAARIRGGAPGEVWLVEHEPVFTAGRATPAEECDASMLAVERGGKITYHGPGQLVVYPIVPLPERDVRAWLQAIERLGVAVCARFDLVARASLAGTGVFVDGRKVASIGVAIRHWINLHGIAINVAVDLDAFHTIRPCGLDPDLMSDLSRAAGREIGLEEVKTAVRDALPDLLAPRRT